MSDINSPSSTDPVDPNAASVVAASATASASAESAVGGATSSPSEGSSSAGGEAQPKTFEQLVEERFLKLEAALMGLPAAIHKTQSEGSHASPEEYGSRVLLHLFQSI
jgi:hypothetical protein